MNLHRYLLVTALCATPALAQQPGASEKTTEQQARSYVASAFTTGAAPAIVSEKVVVSPALRQRLDLAPGADGPAVYKAILGVTSGRQVQVRRAAADEIAASEAPAPVSEQPVFAMEAGDATLIMQYDLGHDSISFVGLPGAVAMAAPVVAPAPPQKVPETPPAPAATAAEKPEPAAVAAPKVQVVEPQVPHATPRSMVSMQEPPHPPPLKPSGPCVIKPVMSDQDLVNCGATPR